MGATGGQGLVSDSHRCTEFRQTHYSIVPGTKKLTMPLHVFNWFSVVTVFIYEFRIEIIRDRIES